MTERRLPLALNADVGEGCGQDEALVPLLDEVNIACAEHAGDESSMRQAAALAVAHGCRIGAHPGYADRAHFGRRPLHLPFHRLRALLLEQLQRLERCLQETGGRMVYVKPHGALYNQAVTDPQLAEGLVRVVAEYEPGLAVMTLPGSALAAAAAGAGMAVIAEGFADRRYDSQGRLLPRDHPRAMIEDVDEAVDQACRLQREAGIDSLCVHGDNPRAVAFVQALRQRLRAVPED